VFGLFPRLGDPLRRSFIDHTVAFIGFRDHKENRVAAADPAQALRSE